MVKLLKKAFKNTCIKYNGKYDILVIQNIK
jgi:hypothetical protein